MTGEHEKAERPAELEQLFLRRLARLVELQRRWPSAVDGPIPELLEMALSSTYLDCVGLGLGDRAWRLLGPFESLGERS